MRIKRLAFMSVDDDDDDNDLESKKQQRKALNLNKRMK
jgi:hypothetical protein